MKVAEVKDRIEHLRNRAYDVEAANILEIALHKDVLCAISRGAANAAELAAAALQTESVEFPRHCP